jgi:hypothetical protein
VHGAGQSKGAIIRFSHRPPHQNSETAETAAAARPAETSDRRFERAIDLGFQRGDTLVGIVDLIEGYLGKQVDPARVAPPRVATDGGR